MGFNAGWESAFFFSGSTSDPARWIVGVGDGLLIMIRAGQQHAEEGRPTFRHRDKPWLHSDKASELRLFSAVCDATAHGKPKQNTNATPPFAATAMLSSRF
jgi:hypothetical protein